MKGQIADKLNTEERCELKDEDFGIPETREFPMPDAPHVRAAEAYFRYAPEDKRRAGTPDLDESPEIRSKYSKSDYSRMGPKRKVEDEYKRTVLEVFPHYHYPW